MAGLLVGDAVGGDGAVAIQSLCRIGAVVLTLTRALSTMFSDDLRRCKPCTWTMFSAPCRKVENMSCGKLCNVSRRILSSAWKRSVLPLASVHWDARRTLKAFVIT